MNLPLTPSPSLPEGRGERSLRGQTVLVTRPAHQTAGLAEPLEALGATVVSLPAIAIEAPLDPEPLHEALLNAERYDWIVVTSVNGVRALDISAEHLGVREKIVRRRLAAVGPSTAEGLRKSFREPDAIPEEAIGANVAGCLGDVSGKHILLARADIARKDLPNALRAQGAIVDDIAAYRIVRPEIDVKLPERAPDWIALTSSSGVIGTQESLARQSRESWMRESRLACIGPLTAGTVRELGYEVAVMAEEHTIPGLVEAIVSGSLPPSGGGGQGGGGERAHGAETLYDGFSVTARTPSLTVPPPVRDDRLEMSEEHNPRRQGEPS